MVKDEKELTIAGQCSQRCKVSSGDLCSAAYALKERSLAVGFPDDTKLLRIVKVRIN